MGWRVWLDVEQLLVGSPLDVQLAEGIRQSDAMCVCITRRYCEKVNLANASDNVFKEWNFCQAICKTMIPIVMEADMMDVKEWPPGIMTMVLGNTFYLDASGDDMKDAARRLSAVLHALGLRRRLVHHSWSPIMCRRAPARPLARPRTFITL